MSCSVVQIDQFRHDLHNFLPVILENTSSKISPREAQIHFAIKTLGGALRLSVAALQWLWFAAGFQART